MAIMYGMVHLYQTLFISKTFNVVLGVRACQLLMHRLGFNLIRPQTYPSLENPQEEAREDFKKKSEE